MIEYSLLSAFAEPTVRHQTLVTFSLYLTEVKLPEVSFTSLNFLREVWFPVQGLYLQSTGRSREGKTCVQWIFNLLSLNPVIFGYMHCLYSTENGPWSSVAPVLEIKFGPPYADFGSVWSPPKAREF